jgi:hypothetical protein
VPWGVLTGYAMPVVFAKRGAETNAFVENNLFMKLFIIRIFNDNA